MLFGDCDRCSRLRMDADARRLDVLAGRCAVFAEKPSHRDTAPQTSHRDTAPQITIFDDRDLLTRRTSLGDDVVRQAIGAS